MVVVRWPITRNCGGDCDHTALHLGTADILLMYCTDYNLETHLLVGSELSHIRTKYNADNFTQQRHQFGHSGTS